MTAWYGVFIGVVRGLKVILRTQVILPPMSRGKIVGLAATSDPWFQDFDTKLVAFGSDTMGHLSCPFSVK